MKPLSDYPHYPYYFSGGGEMGNLIRETDWSKTTLGDPKDWPKSLCTMVAVMLDNPFGMYIAWGADYIQLYNDAYRPILGSTKHPNALGISTRETFAEIWHIIGPMFEGVMEGKAIGFPDFMLPLNRHGFVEECFFDFSYSPIRKDDGKVGGILVTVIETTEKKRAIDALKESEARFRTMADNLSQLAWMTDEKGWIFWYNQRWFDYTGTTLEEMQGWGWQKVHHPEKVNDVVEKFSRAIELGQEWEDTFPLLGKDGNYRWFLSRAVPVKDNTGKVVRWFGTNTDITELRDAQQSLIESEARFKRMAEDADIIIGTSDEESRATYFNKAATGLSGKPLEELLNFGWTNLIHPDDRKDFMDNYMVAHSKRLSWAGECRMLSKSGDYVWLLTKGSPRFHTDGSFVGYISSSVDITDRKKAEKAVQESEQNLRNTIVQAPIAMCFLSGQNHIVKLANGPMIELWGKTSAEVLNKPIFEGLPEAKDQGFEQLLDHVFSTGETYTAEGVPIKLPRNGKIETVYVNFVYAPHKEADGAISGVLAVAIDVTPQVLAHQKIEEVVASRTKELAEANQNLQRSNAELGQFAYIASHDLQEPLRKVSTFTQMLEHSLGEINERSKSYLTKINSSTSRMLMLIRDVLTYSQLSKETVFFKPVDIRQVIDEITSDFELLIEQKKATITCGDLPVIEAIPLQMVQLFSNLISNSLKFSTKGKEPVISITSRILTPKETAKYLPQIMNTAYYMIECKDNGIGFNQENADQIFNIFQRLHGREAYSGTGIGLAMCKRIAQNHQGDIFAESAIDNGALFRIILPAKQPRDPNQAGNTPG